MWAVWCVVCGANRHVGSVVCGAPITWEVWCVVFEVRRTRHVGIVVCGVWGGWCGVWGVFTTWHVSEVVQHLHPKP